MRFVAGLGLRSAGVKVCTGVRARLAVGVRFGAGLRVGWGDAAVILLRLFPAHSLEFVTFAW